MRGDLVPAFPTKWHFLWADVLIGFDAERQRLLSLQGEQGPLLGMWTDEQAAADQLPEGYRLMVTPVRPRLAELPDGVGVIVDPGTPSSTIIDPAYATELKALTAPFPAGAAVVAQAWELPEELEQGLRAVAADYAFLDRVWAIQHTVEDSPPIGALVYDTDVSSEAQESAADALLRVLETVDSPAELGVLGAHVLSLRDLPENLREALLQQPPVHAARSR